jgi:hypothetical protein
VVVEFWEQMVGLDETEIEVVVVAVAAAQHEAEGDWRQRIHAAWDSYAFLPVVPFVEAVLLLQIEEEDWVLEGLFGAVVLDVVRLHRDCHSVAAVHSKEGGHGARVLLAYAGSLEDTMALAPAQDAALPCLVQTTEDEEDAQLLMAIRSHLADDSYSSAWILAGLLLQLKTADSASVDCSKSHPAFGHWLAEVAFVMEALRGVRKYQ